MSILSSFKFVTDFIVNEIHETILRRLLCSHRKLVFRGLPVPSGLVLLKLNELLFVYFSQGPERCFPSPSLQVKWRVLIRDLAILEPSAWADFLYFTSLLR